MERTAVREATQLSAEMLQCVEDCQECHAICTETIMYCLQMGGRHADATHIRTMLDCAEACATSAHFMLRQSALHRRTCAVCAEACTECAVSCERFTDDQVMQQCTEACRNTAASNEKLARGD